MASITASVVVAAHGVSARRASLKARVAQKSVAAFAVSNGSRVQMMQVRAAFLSPTPAPCFASFARPVKRSFRVKGGLV